MYNTNRDGMILDNYYSTDQGLGLEVDSLENLFEIDDWFLGSLECGEENPYPSPSFAP